MNIFPLKYAQSSSIPWKGSAISAPSLNSFKGLKRDINIFFDKSGINAWTLSIDNFQKYNNKEHTNIPLSDFNKIGQYLGTDPDH